MRKLVLLLAALALLGAACGDSTPVGAGPVTTQETPGGGTAPPETTAPPPTPGGGDGTTTSTTTTTSVPAATRTVSVYLFDDDPAGPYLVPVERSIPDTPEVGTNALQALLAGPSPAELAEFSSEIPPDTLLLGLGIAGGLATVDLSREFEAGGGTFSMTGRLAQVVYTITQFPTVDRVTFRLDSQPVSVFSGEGIMLDEPVGRDDYRDLLPPGFDDTPVAVPQRWEQEDLPVGGVPAAELSRVVLVASDDVLNVRSGPGVDNEIVGMLAPTVTARRTGNTAPVGRSTWAELVTPDGTGWVNATFLGAAVDHTAFAGDPAARSRLDDLAEIVATGGDLRDVVSRRGLYVAHHAPPRRFNPDELAGILTDGTTYQWPSNAADLEDVPFRTFAEAVATRYLQAYDDPDVVVQANEPIEAGNGRPAEFAIPFEFQNFNYWTVYDPGDNPDFGGLDWTIWYVSIDYEDGRPVVVGLTLDEWAP